MIFFKLFLLRKIPSFQVRLEPTTLPVRRSITIELLVEQRICYFSIAELPRGLYENHCVYHVID